MYQDIFPASDPRRQEYGKVILSVLQLLVTKDLWPLVHVATKFACTYALKHTHIWLVWIGDYKSILDTVFNIICSKFFIGPVTVWYQFITLTFVVKKMEDNETRWYHDPNQGFFLCATAQTDYDLEKPKGEDILAMHKLSNLSSIACRPTTTCPHVVVRRMMGSNFHPYPDPKKKKKSNYFFFHKIKKIKHW